MSSLFRYSYYRQLAQEQKISQDSGFNAATPLSRAQVLELGFGHRSLLKCRDCGGELQLLETYPAQRAPPLEAQAGLC